MKKVYLIMIALLICALTAGNAYARTPSGERYASIGYRQVSPGNDYAAAFDDKIDGLSVRLNLPLSKTVDFTAEITENKLEGTAGVLGLKVDYKTLSLGLLRFFSPEDKINPYIGISLEYVESEITDCDVSGCFDAGGANIAGLAARLGVEMDYGDLAALRIYALYSDPDNIDTANGGTDSYKSIGAELHLWITDRVALMFAPETSLDNGDDIYLAALEIMF